MWSIVVVMPPVAYASAIFIRLYGNTRFPLFWQTNQVPAMTTVEPLHYPSAVLCTGSFPFALRVLELDVIKGTVLSDL